MRGAFFFLLMACSNAPPVQMQDPMGDPDTGTGVTRHDAGNTFADTGVKGFNCDPPAKPGELYTMSAENLAGTKMVSMCEFRGKVMLIVNVASHCGYTPQYAGLQADYDKYNPKGFEILGFPCNQFGAQEPGTSEDISTFCTSMYGITFPMFSKIDVNGPMADPIYVWLKAQPGGAGDITWNFNKFLIGRDGKLIKRYDSAITPQDPGLIADIEAALAK